MIRKLIYSHRFLLAQLHFESLVGKTTVKAVRTTLAKMPTGSDAYAHAYQKAMEQIEGQLEDQEKLAKRALLWITFAKRPLTTTELQHALAIEVGQPELDEDNLPEIEDIISFCAGLVTVDAQSGVIRLVHYTTQEYFEQTQKHWFPDAETDITNTCVAYLSFDTFESGFCESDEAFEERLRSNLLYDYAAHHWGNHARGFSSLCLEAINFLKNGAKVQAASQPLMVNVKWYPEYSQRVSEVTGLHLASFFGLQEAACILLQHGRNVAARDSCGWTPLKYAATNGHGAVVWLLLENGAAIDEASDIGRTPLSYAAEKGHEAVVRLLLEKGAAIDEASDIGRTPLSYAAENGHEAVVRLLLEKGVAIDVADKFNISPLSYAAANGHEAVVRLLLEKGAAIDEASDIGRTPLSYAAENGHKAVVRLLLEKGVAIDAAGKYDGTPLSSAAKKGHEAIVRLLLEKGAAIEAANNPGRAPLSYAAEEGHEAVVQLLLEKGAAIEAANNFGWTPLLYAAYEGHEAVEALLCSYNA